MRLKRTYSERERCVQIGGLAGIVSSFRFFKKPLRLFQQLAAELVKARHPAPDSRPPLLQAALVSRGTSLSRARPKLSLCLRLSRLENRIVQRSVPSLWRPSDCRVFDSFLGLFCADLWRE